MNKSELENYVNDGMTIRNIAKLKKVSYTSIRYWLQRYQLKTRGRKKPFNCHRCGETNSKNFYGRQKSLCKKCRDKDALKLQKDKRIYAIKKLGGKCSKCGYSKYIGSLDIHHLDPNKKDSNFHQMRSWSYNKIDRELTDCVILCANCHREEHHK